MNRIEFDALQEELMAQIPALRETIEAVNTGNHYKAAILAYRYPAVQAAAKRLAIIESDRLRVMNVTMMLTGLCRQDAEMAITQYCTHHQIGWAEFYDRLMAGRIPDLANLSETLTESLGEADSP